MEHLKDSAVSAVRVREARRARGIAGVELARRIGVSRQTIHAIESGEFVPNTAVALKMARILGVRVEELFVISTDAPDEPLERATAELLSIQRQKHVTGELVRTGRVGRRSVAAPAARFPTFLPEADGYLSSQRKSGAEIRLADNASGQNRLFVAGCDPALSVFARELRLAGTEAITVYCSSQQALSWLKRGLVHVAGTHLRDHQTGEYNLSTIRSMLGRKKVQVVTFAEWEQGLVVQNGNPKRIRSVADLARKQITMVNRETGSGARDLLDCHLRQASIPTSAVQGYGRIAPSHLAAALAVADSQADCCIAPMSVAKCFGLDFVPLSQERFDLAVAPHTCSLTTLQAIFDTLNAAKLRRKLAMLAGYEVRRTGQRLI